MLNLKELGKVVNLKMENKWLTLLLISKNNDDTSVRFPLLTTRKDNICCIDA